MQHNYCLLLLLLFNPSFGLNFCEQERSSYFHFRVVSGVTVDDGVNWMAKLISYGNNHEGILCGATVIDDSWLLTAAHCARQMLSHSYVILRSPSTNLETTYPVEGAFVHPEYSNVTATNDIALLKVSTSFKRHGISPVCLVDDDSKLLKKYKDGVVLGYGLALDPNSTSSSPKLIPSDNVLQNGTVPIIPDAECVKTWSKISFRAVDITKNQICAGSYLHGTAPGDSGGPLLILKANGEYVQVGVTSYGADGLEGVIEQKKFPGVYTRVSKYIPWIESVISNVSLLKTPLPMSLLIIFLSRSFWC